MQEHKKDFADLLGSYRVRAGLKQQELANSVGVHRNTVVKWETRTTFPDARVQVRRLADELYLTKEERKAFFEAAHFSVEEWPLQLWFVPFQRDPFFCGREEELASLRQRLVPGGMTAMTQAISGMGGIGKTHTAIEYAHRFCRCYEAVLWLQADSWEILAEGCARLLAELGSSEQGNTQQPVDEVQRWLRKNRHWLLILDNVEDPQTFLPRIVPTSHQGSVLMTTRVQDVEPLGLTQALAPLSEQEGVLFLLRRTKAIAPEALQHHVSCEQYAEAQRIWQLMEGLPLALDQAAAYILETGCSFSTYLEQYKERRAELLQRRGKRFLGHERSVATTISLAIKQIEGHNQTAGELLRICALLYHEALPEELFQEGAAHFQLSFHTKGEELNLALGLLQEYSLLQRFPESKTFTLHRLVQAVLQDRLSEQERALWTERCLKAVNSVFPAVDHATWLRCKRLVNHALACTSEGVTEPHLQHDLVALLFKTAKYLEDQAQCALADSLFLRILTMYEQVLSVDDQQESEVLTRLVTPYVHQDKYVQAESLYLRYRYSGPNA